MIEAAIEFLEAGAEAGIFFVGAQLYVAYQGRELCNEAFGLATPSIRMTRRTVLPFHCATKPIIAVGVLRLVDEGLLDLDAPLHEYLPDLPASRNVSIRQLLCHRGGASPRQAIIGLETDAQLRELALETWHRPQGLPAQSPVYSPAAGWHLIGLAIRTAFDIDICRYTTDEVLRRTGTSDCWISPSNDEYASFRDRLGCHYVYSADGHLTPVTTHQHRVVCTQFNPSSGGFGTAQALGSFYGRCLENYSEAGPLLSRRSLQQALTPDQDRGFDPVMGRWCQYAMGFMVDLADHEFGSRCSIQSFGHSAAGGAVFAFADPAHDLAVACMVTTLFDHDTAIQARRPYVVDALYREVDALTTPAGDTGRWLRGLRNMRHSARRKSH